MTTKLKSNDIKETIINFLMDIQPSLGITEKTKFATRKQIQIHLETCDFKMGKVTALKYINELKVEKIILEKGDGPMKVYYINKEYSHLDEVNFEMRKIILKYINFKIQKNDFSYYIPSLDALVSDLKDLIPEYADYNIEKNEMIGVFHKYLSTINNRLIFSPKFMITENLCYNCGKQIENFGFIQSYVVHEFLTLIYDMAMIKINVRSGNDQFLKMFLKSNKTKSEVAREYQIKNNQKLSKYNIFKDPKSFDKEIRRFRFDLDPSELSNNYQKILEYYLKTLCERDADSDIGIENYYLLDIVNYGVIHPKCISYSSNDEFEIFSIDEIDSKINDIYLTENSAFNQLKHDVLYPQLSRYEGSFKDRYNCASCSLPIFLGYFEGKKQLLKGLINRNPIDQLSNHVLLKERAVPQEHIELNEEDFDLLHGSDDLSSKFIVQYRIPFKIDHGKYVHLWCNPV